MSAYCLQSPADVHANVVPHNPIHLSRRQREVLRLLGDGLSNKRIARALDIAEGTVKQHIKCVLEELGASNRLQAVIYAYRSGVLPTFAQAVMPNESGIASTPPLHVAVG